MRVGQTASDEALGAERRKHFVVREFVTDSGSDAEAALIQDQLAGAAAETQAQGIRQLSMARQCQQIGAIVVEAVELGEKNVLDPEGIAEQKNQGMEELFSDHRRQAGGDVSYDFVVPILRAAAEIHAYANS